MSETQTREALVEMMARAICKVNEVSDDVFTEQPLHNRWIEDAAAALAALEAAGVRLVPGEAIEEASAQIAGDGWRTMESAPIGESFLATCRVKNMKGNQWWETYCIVIDDSTGEIDTGIDQPWSLEDYEFWQPLPAPPAPAETDTLANQETTP